ncbi:MAG: hypothetical protein IKH16_00810, partial [Selenomonadaceae bacterium]|nr:hypothetical protein [Selenomonadaceae bacterium]
SQKGAARRERRNPGRNSLLVIVASDVPDYQLLLIFYCEQGRFLAYKNYYTSRVYAWNIM